MFPSMMTWKICKFTDIATENVATSSEENAEDKISDEVASINLSVQPQHSRSDKCSLVCLVLSNFSSVGAFLILMGTMFIVSSISNKHQEAMTMKMNSSRHVRMSEILKQGHADELESGFSSVATANVQMCCFGLPRVRLIQLYRLHAQDTLLFLI